MQGNAGFRTLQAGAALELGVAPAASVQIRAGYARHTAGTAEVSHHPYLGVGLHRRF